MSLIISYNCKKPYSSKPRPDVPLGSGNNGDVLLGCTMQKEILMWNGSVDDDVNLLGPRI